MTIKVDNTTQAVAITNPTDNIAGVSGINQAYVDAGDNARKIQKPLTLGSRMIVMGDSITAGAGSLLSSNSNNGDSRQAVGCWFSRLCGQHPDRYYKIRNGGIGGDIVGGLATLTNSVAAAATSITIQMVWGARPYNTAIAVYVGGYVLNNDAKTISSVVDNGGGSYTINFTTGLSNPHNAGEEVGWGMHGRFKAHVLDWNPEICLIAAGTNDSGGTLTAAEVASSLMDMGQRCRNANVEPIFIELTPRSTNQSNVMAINQELRYKCRIGGTEGQYHLIPMYETFTKSAGGTIVGNGSYAISGNYYPYTGTATSGTTTTLTKTAAGWPNFATQTWRLRIVGGQGLGQSVLISSNTSTVLTFSALGTAPNNTSLYSIEPQANSATSTTLTWTSAGWTTNAYAGMALKIIGGTGVGQTRTIVSNTATVLTVSTAFTVTPDATSTFLIESDVADGLHPTDTGHQKYADQVDSFLQKIPMRFSTMVRSQMDTDPTNLIQNANFLTASSGIPTGWTSSPFFAVNITPAIEVPAASDNIVGNWFTFTAAAGTGNWAIDRAVTAQNVGDLIYLCARIRTTGFTAGCLATVQFLTGSFTLDLGVNIADNMDWVCMVTTATLSSTASSSFRIQILPNGGSGKLWVAQPYMYNLTTNSRLA